MAELDTNKPLLPKAAAVWLIDNSALTFEQIGDFTGLHSIEVQALADEEVGRGIVGKSPIDSCEVTKDEIARCEADPIARLVMSKSELPSVKIRSKGPRYTPVSKRGDKPDAIAYIQKHNPEVKDSQIVKLVGTTKPTIQAIRERTHASISNIKPRHPADLGLCTYVEYQKAVDKGLRAIGKDPETVAAEKEAAAVAAAAESAAAHAPSAENAFGAGFDFSNFMKTGSGDTADSE